MKAKVFTLTLGLLLVILILHTPAFAQVQKATFHLDSFFCGNDCVSAVRKVMSDSTETLSHIDIDGKENTAVVYPEARQSFDLYELRKELRNAKQTLKQIDLVVTGEIVDYVKVYSGSIIRPRKALWIKDTGQRFILPEGEQLSQLLAAIPAGQQVTIEGNVPAFQEKYLPVLTISKFARTEALAKVDAIGETKMASKKVDKSKA